jgi:hypothetical protein
MGSTPNFPATDLTTSITDQQRTQSDLTGKLGQIETELTDFLDDETITTLANYQTISGEVNNLIPLITSFNTSVNQISNKMLDTNNLLNSSLGQITTNYQLNSMISDKTLDNITAQNEQLTQEFNNKTRMTEINNYFSNMNTYLILVMRNIALIIAVIIVFITLSKRGILPENISTLMIVIGVLGIIGYVIYTIYDINIRDRFNFNEYVIPFDPTAKQLESSDRSGGLTDIRKVLGREFIGELDKLQGITGTCFGDDCCEPGTIYDIKRKACIIQCSSGEIYTQVVDPITGEISGNCI